MCVCVCVCVDLTDCHLGLVAVFNTEQRKSELCCSVDKILETGNVRKGELPTLRGSLLFAENQNFGRLHNSHMKTVSRHAELDCAGKVDSDLSDALKLLRDRIVLAEPRRVSAVERRVWHVYTDACDEKDGQAGIGGVLVDQYGILLQHFGVFLDDDQTSVVDLADNETIIAELELLAIWVGIVMFEKFLLGGDVVFFCDNNAVLSAMIAGKSSNRAMNKILDHRCLYGRTDRG